jgi:thiamine-monophosphate kinase
MRSSDATTLTGEFSLIDRFFKRRSAIPRVRLGIGDDAAIIAPAPGSELAISVDMLVEGRTSCPYRPGSPRAQDARSQLVGPRGDGRDAAVGAPWRRVARRRRRMGVRVHARTLCARRSLTACPLIGGDTTRGPRNLCVTVIGEVPAGTAITRAGAHVDDDVYVSGTLGDAMLALAALQGRCNVDASTLHSLRARLERPEPQIALGSRLRGVATAALDVSDGLAGDLQHILDASRVGADVDVAAIPRSGALDATPARKRARARAFLAPRGRGRLRALLHGVALGARSRCGHRQGRSTSALRASARSPQRPGLRVRDERGEPMCDLPRAFDHFRS